MFVNPELPGSKARCHQVKHSDTNAIRTQTIAVSSEVLEQMTKEEMEKGLVPQQQITLMPTQILPTTNNDRFPSTFLTQMRG